MGGGFGGGLLCLVKKNDISEFKSDLLSKLKTYKIPKANFFHLQRSEGLTIWKQA